MGVNQYAAKSVGRSHNQGQLDCYEERRDSTVFHRLFQTNEDVVNLAFLLMRPDLKGRLSGLPLAVQKI